MTNCHEGSLNDLAHYGRSAFDPTWGATARGFRAGVFRDRYGQECSIQESSLATEHAIWLGPDPCRMHLTIDQVRGLVHVLTDYLIDGNLRAQYPDQRFDPEAEVEEADDDTDSVQTGLLLQDAVAWIKAACAEHPGLMPPSWVDEPTD